MKTKLMIPMMMFLLLFSPWGTPMLWGMEEEAKDLKANSQRSPSITEEAYGGALREQFINARDGLIKDLSEWTPYKKQGRAMSPEREKVELSILAHMKRLIETMVQLPPSVHLPDPLNFRGMILNFQGSVGRRLRAGTETLALQELFKSEPLQKIIEACPDPSKQQQLNNVFKENDESFVQCIGYLSQICDPKDSGHPPVRISEPAFPEGIKKGALCFYPIEWASPAPSLPYYDLDAPPTELVPSLLEAVQALPSTSS